LGAIASINDPPAFHPLDQFFKLLDLEYGAFMEIKFKRSKISKRKMMIFQARPDAPPSSLLDSKQA
jgi:hypothetical protein